MAHGVLLMPGRSAWAVRELDGGKRSPDGPGPLLMSSRGAQRGHLDRPRVPMGAHRGRGAAMSMQTNGPGSSRHVAGSLIELLGGEIAGEPVAGDDGKTGARLERVTIDGRSYVLKHLHLDDDWLMRATGDLEIRAVTVWRAGWLDRLPPELDAAVVGAAWDDRPGGRGAVLVMHDVADHLVPEGDDELPLEQHHAFVDHMAALHATFWGSTATAELLSLSTRLVFFGPQLGVTERARGGTDPVPTQFVPQGWAHLAERATKTSAILTGLLADPTPLAD